MSHDERDRPSDAERPNLGSIFLGPKGENAAVLERLLLEALRDHVFWRRNFHPEDGFLIQESDKRSESFQRSVAVLSQELLSLLGQLKAGVPFFSPRYIGHMSSDLTMASLVGYFATMLYNPNNVAVEASPVTTRMELEVAAQLAAMVGYPAERQWGHLTSGGTVANFEALWAARNVKYLPVAAFGAAQELGLEDVEVRLPDGRAKALGTLGLWSLLNIEPEAALDLVDAMRSAGGDDEALLAALGGHSLAKLGYQEYARRLTATFGDPLPAGVVLVPSTAHYSWEKICHALGIGSQQLVHVPVDRQFRMDPDALDETVGRLVEERRPVIACVAVVGTTEESAVDRVDLIVECRRRAAERGLAFHLHADAAWGGYAVSITRDGDGARRSYEEALGDAAPEVWPREGVYKALCAVEETDSITIDPHKLGFVPYPAGAVSFRDRRARDLLAVDAPYLFHRGQSAWGAIGRYIFEGSKPGAAAAAVWMSHKVLPLDARGYGRLICDASRGALALHRRLERGDWGDFRLALLPRPDLNIVCFAVGHASFRTPEECNELADRVYAAMSVGSGHPAPRLDYFVTKTVLRWEQYGEASAAVIAGLGFTLDECRRAGGVHVVRCTVMDPFLADRRAEVDHIEGFARCLREVLESEMAQR
jgi:glutamate/tyrosine decarboxylase-like PLP-dependent enzyme